MLTKDTVVCMSIAQEPGLTGSTVHSYLNSKMGINAIYKPFRLDARDESIRGTLAGMLSLNIRGCSVTSPFKEDVIQYADVVTSLVKATNSTNTILNNDGQLVAYNTDVHGFVKAMEMMSFPKLESVLVLGTGPAARSVTFALKTLMGVKNVAIISRFSNSKVTALELGVSFGTYGDLAQAQNIDMIVNATTHGLKDDSYAVNVSSEYPTGQNLIEIVQGIQPKFVFDLVAHNTKLVAECNIAGISAHNGRLMAVLQSIMQYSIYMQLDYDALVETHLDDILKLFE